MSSAASPSSNMNALDLLCAQTLDTTRFVSAAPSAFDPALMPFLLPMGAMYTGAPKPLPVMPSAQPVTPEDIEFGEFESAPKATAAVSTVLISANAKAPSKGSAAAKAPAKEKEKEAELNEVQMGVWTQLVGKNAKEKCSAKTASMLVRKPINSDIDRIRRIATFQQYGFTPTEATAMVDKLFPPKVTAKK